MAIIFIPSSLSNTIEYPVFFYSPIGFIPLAFIKEILCARSLKCLKGATVDFKIRAYSHFTDKLRNKKRRNVPEMLHCVFKRFFLAE